MSTYNVYTSDGTTSEYAVSFSYLDQDHVQVTVNGDAVGFSWLSSTLIKLDDVPASGDILVIRRRTPAELLVEFSIPSGLRARDLNTSYQHPLRIAEEGFDLAEWSMQRSIATDQWDAANRRINNVGTPTADADAANKGYVDAALVDAIELSLGDAGALVLNEIPVTPEGATTGRTLPVSQGDWKNVLAYGLKRDGTDVGPALKALCDGLKAAGEPCVIQFPPGDYTLSSNVQIEFPPNCAVYGYGSRLIVADGSHNTAFQIRNADNVAVLGLELVCTREDDSRPYAISIQNSNDVTLLKCKVTGPFRYGVLASQDTSVTPQVLGTCNDLTIMGCTLEGIQELGFELFPKVISKRALIIGNKAIDCGNGLTTGGAGYKMSHYDPLIALGNIAEGCQIGFNTGMWVNSIYEANHAIDCDRAGFAGTIQDWEGGSVGSIEAPHETLVIRDNVVRHREGFTPTLTTDYALDFNGNGFSSVPDLMLFESNRIEGVKGNLGRFEFQQTFEGLVFRENAFRHCTGVLFKIDGTAAKVLGAVVENNVFDFTNANSANAHVSLDIPHGRSVRNTIIGAGSFPLRIAGSRAASVDDLFLGCNITNESSNAAVSVTDLVTNAITVTGARVINGAEGHLTHWIHAASANPTITVFDLRSPHKLITRTNATANITAGDSNMAVGLTRWFWNSAAPATGAHLQGDIVWNTAPTTGEPVGWICMANGDPGTWFPFGGVQVANPYTITTGTTKRTLDVSTAALADVAQTLGTLIADLKSIGLLS